MIAAATTSPVSVPLLRGLAHGINLGNKLDAPNEGDYGPKLTEHHIALVAAAGFDHVRVPVRFSNHAGDTPPYTIDEPLFERVDWVVEQALSHRLTVIVDLHHYHELMTAPAAHSERFVALWGQIARRYRDAPDEVVFELLNEPSGELSAAAWNSLLVRALAEVRQTNPTRRVVIDSAFWAAADRLAELELPADDRNLVVSFHMYQPILFTHQGASWMKPEFQTTGVVFPGPPSEPVEPVAAARAEQWAATWFRDYNRNASHDNPSSRRAVEHEFDMAQQFSRATQRPIYVGEFGAIDIADKASRERYVAMVREEAERRQMGWAYWDDSGAFRALDGETGAWVPYLRTALGR